ncbi:hypothetical protein BCR39DRAFT_74418 [Naematelia encephala]|uniref:Uncharacterized protein n=1 Tax=Naematelia encephala TaxID=71784 RepID=A0A1Y2AG81_9TREE|nr:hypothetical protein BCR39DRAFT_74418 [Naematelia encephala]
MSRLASLTPSRAPSTPPQAVHTPSSPLKGSETTYHRKLRLVIGEIRKVVKSWDELVRDGIKVGRGCVDSATEMDNILALPETPERPPITPHFEALYTSRTALESVLTKLDKSLHRLSLLVDQAETLYFEAYAHMGATFCLVEIQWATWTMDHLVNTLPALVSQHNQHLSQLTLLSRVLLSSESTFDESKLALETWLYLSRGGDRWEAVREWEELVDFELAPQGGMEDDDEDEYVSKRGKKKAKGR